MSNIATLLVEGHPERTLLSPGLFRVDMDGFVVDVAIDDLDVNAGMSEFESVGAELWPGEPTETVVIRLLQLDLYETLETLREDEVSVRFGWGGFRVAS